MKNNPFRLIKPTLLCLTLCAIWGNAQATKLNITQTPLFLKQKEAPLVLLAMGKDHKMFYEAYDDRSDLDGDGYLDIGYRPEDRTIATDTSGGTSTLKAIKSYYGYFDSFKCYTYDGSGTAGIFTPTRKTTTKKCGGTGEWSGDFLNYLTTTRIDALRKVFYGGKRSTDATGSTILERAWFPQDAHGWAKEYTSPSVDGYNIRDYAPLDVPVGGRRHLFASTALTCSTNTSYGTESANDPGCVAGLKDQPILRVLNDTTFRTWSWLSKERPVGGSTCNREDNTAIKCIVASIPTTSWTKVPDNALGPIGWKGYAAVAGTTITSNTDFNTRLAAAGAPIGSGSVTQINGNTDFDLPSPNNADNYFVVFTASFTPPATGTYSFGVDGTDAVEVKIGTNTLGNVNNNPVIASRYGANTTEANSETAPQGSTGTVTLTAGTTYTLQFRLHEKLNAVGYRLYWKTPVAIPASNITSYVVRNAVCINNLLEDNCTQYGVNFKPDGVLQQQGKNDAMFFGLMSGSYSNSVEGGVLRRNIGSIWDEIDKTTGIFKSVTTATTANPMADGGGIIKTMNDFKIRGWNNSTTSLYDYTSNCGGNNSAYYYTGPLSEGTGSDCMDWGNPMAEIMYEGLRYLAGKNTPTTIFSNGTAATEISGISSAVTWKRPYIDNTFSVTDSAGVVSSQKFEYCAKPFIMAISDVNTSFDSDNLPGVSNWNAASSKTKAANDLGVSFNAASLADTIWNTEFGGGSAVTKSIYIGQRADQALSEANAPSAKSVSSFNVRGQAPGEPSREGSYYAASVAWHGHTNKLSDLNGGLASGKAIDGVDFFSIALASPLPEIEIPIPNSTKKVTFVPFSKTVSGTFGGATYKPTNQIVDFYVQSITNVPGYAFDANINEGRPQYIFRINYEDVENGNDHDMDAIARYTLKVTSTNKVEISVVSEYGAGSADQHMGFIISGTDKDGPKLVVQDIKPTPDTTSNEYDYPPHVAGTKLPYTFKEEFTPSNNAAASLLESPLYYAAKYGAFKDTGGVPVTFPSTAPISDGLLTSADLIGGNSAWDSDDNNGVPDSYFLVSNAGKLEEQLNKALDKIKNNQGTISKLSANSSRVRASTKVYQGIFNSSDWSGNLISLSINQTAGATFGDLVKTATDWDGAALLTAMPPANRNVYTFNPNTSAGAPFDTTTNIGTTLTTQLNGNVTCTSGTLAPVSCTTPTVDGKAQARINYLRGDTSDQSFRERKSFMGDILNSDPIYWSKAPPISREASFNTYRELTGTQKPMIYVGSNNGFLHGFNASIGHADSGKEEIAYVPLGSYYKLPLLTSPDYIDHQYILDGLLTVFSIRLSNQFPDASRRDKYRSVLVGSMGAGGKGYFALDVTEPGTPDGTSGFTQSAANAQKIVMWDRTGYWFGTEDLDAGHSYSRPQVSDVFCPSATEELGACVAGERTSALIVGNGYNSTNERAVLYIINVENGKTIKKIYTDLTIGGGNGLSTPAIYDANVDGVVDYVYAGDLKGKLWRFDLTSDYDLINDTNYADDHPWTANLPGATSATPLLDASTISGFSQPIVTRPIVFDQTNGYSGVVVTFPTGRYLEKGDVSTSIQQAIYGIWDPLIVTGANKTTQTTVASQLVTQSTQQIPSTKFFATSQRPVNYKYSDTDTTKIKKGWRVNFTTNTQKGVNDPESDASNLTITATEPSLLRCEPAGISYVYSLNALTGGAPDSQVFGTRGTKDEISVVNPDTGLTEKFIVYDNIIKGTTEVGIHDTPLTLSCRNNCGTPPVAGTECLNGNSAYAFTAGSAGGLNKEKVCSKALEGRVSWRELFQ